MNPQGSNRGTPNFGIAETVHSQANKAMTNGALDTFNAAARIDDLTENGMHASLLKTAHSCPPWTDGALSPKAYGSHDIRELPSPVERMRKPDPPEIIQVINSYQAQGILQAQPDIQLMEQGGMEYAAATHVQAFVTLKKAMGPLQHNVDDNTLMVLSVKQVLMQLEENRALNRESRQYAVELAKHTVETNQRERHHQENIQATNKAIDWGQVIRKEQEVCMEAIVVATLLGLAITLVIRGFRQVEKLHQWLLTLFYEDCMTLLKAPSPENATFFSWSWSYLSSWTPMHYAPRLTMACDVGYGIATAGFLLAMLLGGAVVFCGPNFAKFCFLVGAVFYFVFFTDSGWLDLFVWSAPCLIWTCLFYLVVSQYTLKKLKLVVDHAKNARSHGEDARITLEQMRLCINSLPFACCVFELIQIYCSMVALGGLLVFFGVLYFVHEQLTAFVYAVYKWVSEGTGKLLVTFGLVAFCLVFGVLYYFHEQLADTGYSVYNGVTEGTKKVLDTFGINKT